MTKNPDWTRDELILALDLYFKVDTAHTSKTNPDVVALSDLLNVLPIHSGQTMDTTFRNPAGVYMKLSNFLHLDPNHQAMGLHAVSKLTVEVWDEFSVDRVRLEKVAAAIRHNYQAIPPPPPISPSEDEAADDAEFPEGRVLTRLHQIRERNATLVKRKKQVVLKKTGKLACEVCNFDFARTYGQLGEGFAECHHTVPISELKHEQTRQIADLAIVCANCHSMLHRARPVLTVQELREIVMAKAAETPA
jgi:5-methylcytosine-specific restriction protein A